MWCNHDNSAHVYPITNRRQHRTSIKLLTQQTKILLFVLLITFLRQQNDVYLHFGTGFQENKTEHTTFDFMLLS